MEKDKLEKQQLELSEKTAELKKMRFFAKKKLDYAKNLPIDEFKARQSTINTHPYYTQQDVSHSINSNVSGKKSLKLEKKHIIHLDDYYSNLMPNN